MNRLVLLLLNFPAITAFAQPNNVESTAAQPGSETTISRPLTVASSNWKLVWSDEFNYTGLPDKSKWDYEQGFVRNKEPQYYTTARPENSRVENGTLVLEARKENYPNAAWHPGSAEPQRSAYTSASLITLGKAGWKYGRIEVRAKVPRGAGAWPAIWLLGEDRGRVKWPFCGEIDILEYLGRDPSKVYGTVHYADAAGQYAHQGESPVVGDPAGDFHIYALNWYPDRLEFFYDSLRYFVFDGSKGGEIFRKKFYLLLNLALGHEGSWAGPVADSVLPSKYYIDYVRVYQSAGTAALHPITKKGATPATTMDPTLTLMKKVADWQLGYWAKQGKRWPVYDWVNAVSYTGIMELARVSGDSVYYRALHAIGDSMDWNTGPRRTMADDYCIGQTYAQLYPVYRDPRILAHLRAVCDTIGSLAHNGSLEWVDNIYLREWAWCDALYMGPPTLAYLSTVTGDRHYLDIADSLWWKTTAYLFDTTQHLYYRDSRYFQQREANGQKMFWSRGNGWVMGGLVRVLANMPENYPDRPRLLRLYRQMAARITGLQQPDGTWHTSLLDPGSYPNKETSGTALYCYALAWGIHHGILSRKEYLPVARKAWEALKAAVHPDGKLGFVQQIGDRPGAADENSTEAYGTGAFLLAGSEMRALEKQ